MEDSKFTAVISVYIKDNPEYFDRALKSITTEQTKQPDELLIVADGPLTAELDKVIAKYQTSLGEKCRVHRCERNGGHGEARRFAVSTASNPIVAVMDSDDVSSPDRFESQLSYLASHPDCDVVGGQITEFVDSEENIVGTRVVPLTHEEVASYLKSRCPMNHVTVMMRTKSVIAAGNYQDWHYDEDYFLWVRMTLAGCNFANLPDVLVNVRVGADMYQRRGGWKYFKSEAKLQKYMLEHKLIGFPRYVYNVLGRFTVQVAMPNWLRGFVFQKLFRK